MYAILTNIVFEFLCMYSNNSNLETYVINKYLDVLNNLYTNEAVFCFLYKDQLKYYFLRLFYYLSKTLFHLGQG